MALTMRVLARWKVMADILSRHGVNKLPALSTRKHIRNHEGMSNGVAQTIVSCGQVEGKLPRRKRHVSENANRSFVFLLHTSLRRVYYLYFLYAYHFCKTKKMHASQLKVTLRMICSFED